MGVRVTTIDTRLMYAVETTAGTRPTTGFKLIPEVKAMPALDDTPETIDSTTLLETEYMTSEPGLKSNGVKDYTANLTNELLTFWNTLIEEYDTAIAAGKAMWFAHVPNAKLDKCQMYKGTPSPIGMNDVSINSMLEATLHVTPSGGVIWADKPTEAAVVSSTRTTSKNEEV